MRVAGAEKPQRIQKYVRISSTADAQNGKRSYFEAASRSVTQTMARQDAAPSTPLDDDGTQRPAVAGAQRRRQPAPPTIDQLLDRGTVNRNPQRL